MLDLIKNKVELKYQTVALLLRLVAFMVFCLGFSLLSAQKTIADRTISKEQWERATEGLDYSKDIKTKEEEKKRKPKAPSDLPSLPDMTGIGTVIQVLVILLATVLIGWVIFRMIQQPSNRKIDANVVVTLENLEEHLVESDLDRFLREALEAGKYPDAVRIQFLRIMKSLDQKGHIKWAKEKTNRDYLRELSNFAHIKDLRTQTRIYEKVWYGNMEVDRPLYDTLAPAFEALFRKI